MKIILYDACSKFYEMFEYRVPYKCQATVFTAPPRFAATDLPKSIRSEKIRESIRCL